MYGSISPAGEPGQASAPPSKQAPDEQLKADMPVARKSVALAPVSSATITEQSSFIEHPARSLFSYTIAKCRPVVHWMIENRFGLSKLLGCILITAQYKYLFSSEAHSPARSQELIVSACNATHEDGYRTEKVTLSHNATTIQGVICYPPGWHFGKSSDLVVFNNMNGKTLSNFFVDDRLATTPAGNDESKPTETPGNIQQILGCPVLLYDYTGTGCNKPAGLLRHAPTATGETVTKDAMAALHTALTRPGVDRIILMGSSMGGGVSTVALEHYLGGLDKDEAAQTGKRITLVNHDSYSTTSRVVLPRLPELGDKLGRLLGTHIDAVTPMKTLVRRQIDTIVLARESDYKIPKGARMCETFAYNSDKRRNVSIFQSSLYGHSELSCDQMDYLKERLSNSSRTDSGV